MYVPSRRLLIRPCGCCRPPDLSFSLSTLSPLSLTTLHTRLCACSFDNKDNDGDGVMDCQDSQCLAVPLNARKCAQLAKRKHKVNNMIVQFKIVKLTSYRGTYSDLMVKQCARYKMKPVCDHPSYCRNDKKALYLGQKGHLAYPPHRNQAKYKPQGWDQIQRNSNSATSWDGLCYYTSHANKGKALCNVPIKTHSWKTPLQYNPGFMCGKMLKKISGETHRQCFDHKDNDGDGRSDCEDPDCYKDKRIQQRCRMESNRAVKLGGKNGVPAHLYRFKSTILSSKSGSYSSLMIKACNKIGMKPVCDHPSYCKRDTQALYLGQSHHLSYPPHRNNKKYVPDGFAAIEYHSYSANTWKGLCYYAGKASKGRALCNIPIKTHAWKTPTQANPGFMCGKALGIGGGKTAVEVCEQHNYKARDCRRLGCCRYSHGQCKSAIGTRQCTSARGMYVEAYHFKVKHSATMLHTCTCTRQPCLPPMLAWPCKICGFFVRAAGSPTTAPRSATRGTTWCQSSSTRPCSRTCGTSK